jgi:uroporphyrinogen decarboxylase
MRTPAEIFASAIRLDAPVPGEMIPLWELEFHGWEHFSDRPLVVGTEFAGLSRKEQGTALHRNAEVIAGVSEQLGFSAVTVPGGYWEIAPGHPAFYWLPEGAREEQIRLLGDLLGGTVMLAAGCPAVLAMPDAGEYLEFAYTLMERPEEIGQRARNLFNSGIELADRLLDLGIGALYTASDLADNHGLYFDPGQMETLILPYLDRWAEHVNGKGGLSILHSDGNLDACLDRIADTRVMALQAIDPTAGMDLFSARKAVQGKLCLCGNLNCSLFISGTPQQLYEQTRDVLKASGSGGGWVLGASNALEKEMKKENYLAFLQARRDFGTCP